MTNDLIEEQQQEIEKLKEALDKLKNRSSSNSSRTYALKRNLVVLSVVREAGSLILPLLSWLSA